MQPHLLEQWWKTYFATALFGTKMDFWIRENKRHDWILMTFPHRPNIGFYISNKDKRAGLCPAQQQRTIRNFRRIRSVTRFQPLIASLSEPFSLDAIPNVARYWV
jgi:light-regulated signal transduction histidine kinase (bacteriophytochrome)